MLGDGARVILRLSYQLFIGCAVESTEEEGLVCRLLHLTASLTDALEHRVELIGREAARQDVTMLAMLLTKHSVANGSAQGKAPTVVGMVEHAHGHEAKRCLGHTNFSFSELYNKF